MGLDMYAYSVPASQIAGTDVDVVFLTENQSVIPEEDDYSEHNIDTSFAYWRKFNALHGWMETLYERKGGTDDSFNCTHLILRPEDIDQLEHDLNNDQLKPVEGFFFGPQTFDDDDRQVVQDFIDECRDEFKEGNLIAYHAWY